LVLRGSVNLTYMKAKELIEVLQKLDPETLIIVDGYEGNYSIPKKVKSTYVTGPHETQWYYGEYKDCSDDNPDAIKAFYLMR
jgi:hypothetical protein